MVNEVNQLLIAPRRLTHPWRTVCAGRSVRSSKRRGAALLTVLFIASVTTALLIGILDTQTLEYSGLRNTVDAERARYLAEAGIQHALAELEQDITWRAGYSNIAFPVGGSTTYSVSVSDAAGGALLVSATGVSGPISRRLEITLKQGG